MNFAHSTTEPGSGRRRFYVFLAVALAQFVFAIALIGTLCQGFAIPDPRSKQSAAEKHSAAHAAVRAADEAEAAMSEAVEEYANARRVSHDAMQKYDVARKNLLDYLQSHFTESKADAHADSTIESAITPVPSDRTAAVQEKPSMRKGMQPNPQWKKLRDTLADLMRQRDNLLVKLTPSHPTVKALDLTIAEVESQISDTPEEIPQPSESHSAPLLPGTMTSTASNTRLTIEESEAFRQLSTTEETAKKEYQEKLAAEDIAWQRQSQEIEKGFQAIFEMAAEPVEPVVIASVNGANVAYSIALSVIWALAIAWIVARKASVNEKAFDSPAEVRQTLDLPVLGLLPSNPCAFKEQPRREPRWVHRAVMTSEAWLVGVAVLLAVVSLLDPDFFHQLIADPLSACSQRFW